jgi:RNA-binding protein VTS1
MQQKLNSAMGGLSFDNPPRRTNSNPPVSPSPRNSRHLDPSTIQAMFPDAAAALAHQRSLLSSNRNSLNGTLPPRSPALQAAKDLWPENSASPAATKSRPRSADLSTWTQGSTLGVKSPRVPTTTPSIAEDLVSPYPQGASWASMVNTPVVPMFSNPRTQDDLASQTALKLAGWNGNKSSVSGGVINLDSDVRKFRRGGRIGTGQPGMLSAQQHQLRGESPTNIVMYDEHGHLISLPSTTGFRGGGQPLVQRGPSPRPTSPYSATAFGGFTPLGISSPPPFLNPYEHNMSPVLISPEFSGQGYHSDHDRRTSPSSAIFRPGQKYPMSAMSQSMPSPGRRPPPTAKEDPLDPALLDDIPGWLRSLRLHKYTDNLSDVKGGVPALAMLSEEELERRGVSAVGARRKLLKCFEQVRAAGS